MSGGIHIEIAAHRERLRRLARAVAHLHRVAASLALTIVDAETEQAMVAHCPKLLLLRPELQILGGKHPPHLHHFGQIAADVFVLHLTPKKGRVHVLNLCEIGNIGDVIGEI